MGTNSEVATWKQGQTKKAACYWLAGALGLPVAYQEISTGSKRTSCDWQTGRGGTDHGSEYASIGLLDT